MVGGDWGPDQGAAEQPLPRGFPSRSPGSAGPLRRVSPRRPGSPSPRRPGDGRGRARSPATGPCPLSPRCTADPAAALGLTPPSSIIPGGGGQLGDKARNPPPRALPPCPQPGGRAAGRGAAAAAGPELGPPGGLPLFPCCTTVTVAASSAIMKGRQCAGERREPGTSR